MNSPVSAESVPFHRELSFDLIGAALNTGAICAALEAAEGDDQLLEQVRIHIEHGLRKCIRDLRRFLDGQEAHPAYSTYAQRLETCRQARNQLQANETMDLHLNGLIIPIPAPLRRIRRSFGG